MIDVPSSDPRKPEPDPLTDALMVEKRDLAIRIETLQKERDEAISSIKDLESRLRHVDALLAGSNPQDSPREAQVPDPGPAVTERLQAKQLWEVWKRDGVTTYTGREDGERSLNPMQHFMCDNAKGHGFEASGIDADGRLYPGRSGPFEDASGRRLPFKNSYACAKTPKALRVAANMIVRGSARKIVCTEYGSVTYDIQRCSSCRFPRIADGNGELANIRKPISKVTLCSCAPRP